MRFYFGPCSLHYGAVQTRVVLCSTFTEWHGIWYVCIFAMTILIFSPPSACDIAANNYTSQAQLRAKKEGRLSDDPRLYEAVVTLIKSCKLFSRCASKLARSQVSLASCSGHLLRDITF